MSIIVISLDKKKSFIYCLFKIMWHSHAQLNRLGLYIKFTHHFVFAAQ